MKPTAIRPADHYSALPGDEEAADAEAVGVANPIVVGEAEVLVVEPTVTVVRVEAPPRDAFCAGCLVRACCALAICAAVIAGVVFACVYGILNQPNMNIKRNLVDAKNGVVVVNLHNSNPYKVEVEPVECVVWLKAGHKRALGSFKMREKVTVEAYDGVVVTLQNSSRMDPDVVAKIEEKCEDDLSAKLKVHGHATMRQVHGVWTRQRKVISQWDHAPCDASASASVRRRRP